VEHIAGVLLPHLPGDQLLDQPADLLPGRRKVPDSLLPGSLLQGPNSLSMSSVN